MSSPSLRTYKAGSIIYFIEDRGSEIFVLQKGRIILISNSLDNTEVKEDVQKGEFFGVKSALGSYPREETAQVLADSVVLVFTPQMFEAFCMKNTRLVLQMLKVFSGQLRKVHRKVRELLGDTGIEENSVELLRTAESFYKIGENEHARYAFNAFLKHYSNSALAPRVQSMLKMISIGQPYPVEMDSIDSVLEKMRNNDSNNMGAGNTSFNNFHSPDDFNADSMEAPALDDFSSPADTQSMEIPDLEMHDMELHDIGDIDNFDIPDLNIPTASPSRPVAPPAASRAPLSASPVAASAATSSEIAGAGISRLYYDGINAFSRQDWPAAVKLFESALATTKFENDTEAAFLEKALFELGRTYLKKGETDKGIEKLSDLVKKYPRSQNLKKAMIFIAEGSAKKGDKQRAIALLNKVTTMPPVDKDTTYAKQQMERLMKT